MVGLLCLTRFQHYFSYIVAVSFIGEGSRSRSTQKKHLPAAGHCQWQTLPHNVVSMNVYFFHIIFILTRKNIIIINIPQSKYYVIIHNILSLLAEEILWNIQHNNFSKWSKHLNDPAWPCSHMIYLSDIWTCTCI